MPRRKRASVALGLKRKYQRVPFYRGSASSYPFLQSSKNSGNGDVHNVHPMLSDEFHVPLLRRDAIVGYVDGNGGTGRGSVHEMELRFRMAVLYVYMDGVLNALPEGE